MQVYLWAFISILYYISSGRVVFAVLSFGVTALASLFPHFGIPILMLFMMYLVLLILNLYQNLEDKNAEIAEYKMRILSLHERHEGFLENTLNFTTHVKQAFTPMILDPSKSDKNSLDESQEIK
jgi:hypothetical protein